MSLIRKFALLLVVATAALSAWAASAPATICVEIIGCPITGKVEMNSVTPTYPVLWHYTATKGTRTFTFRCVDGVGTEFVVINSSPSATEINDQNSTVSALPPNPAFFPSSSTGSVCTRNFYLVLHSACPCPMTPSITSQTNVSCNGLSNGSVSISPGGGSSPYTYSWGGSSSVTSNTTGTFENLEAGTFAVFVRRPAEKKASQFESLN